MEDTNKPSSLSAIKIMTQDIINRKQSYLSLESLPILNSIEMQDRKKCTEAYKKAIDRNDEAIDFIVDIKDTIFQIKLIRDAIDKSTQLGTQQVKQVEYYIGLLKEVLDLMYDERSKLDRIVRYNEKTFTTYNSIY